MARYRPATDECDYLADGLDQLYGVALTPGEQVVAVEQGTGRALSSVPRRGDRQWTKRAGGRDRNRNGTVLIADTGRVVKVTNSGTGRSSTACSNRRASWPRTARCSSSMPARRP